MKNMAARLVLLFALTVFGAGFSWAANGAADGSGPIHDIFSGTYFEYSGEVVGCSKGNGLMLDVGVDEKIYISGIGPQSYWEEVALEYGVDRPTKGDYITVKGYTVEFILDGDESELVNIAMSVITDGVEVPLRDPVTGDPLWLD